MRSDSESIPLRSWLAACIIMMLAVHVGVTVAYAQGLSRTFSEAAGVKAASDKIYDFESWTFTLGQFAYKINVNGDAWRQAAQRKPQHFQLDLLDSEVNLVRVYYSDYKGDILLLCEDETWDAGSGFISRFDGATLKQKWRAEIPGFNVANGLIEGKYAYLGAIGFAAKLDLDSGRFVWKHEHFYRKYKEDGVFNVFDTPEIVGNEVVYRENQDMYSRPPNVIKFNKYSGKVVDVKVN